MKINDYDRLYRGLASAKTRFEKLRSLFDAIPGQVTPEFADPSFRVQGVKVDVVDEHKNLRIKFTDREVKLVFRHDGKDGGRGIIVAEDWSYGVKEPIRLWSVTFKIGGELDLEPRDGATFTLHNRTDSVELVLTALEASIAREYVPK